LSLRPGDAGLWPEANAILTITANDDVAPFRAS